MKISLDCPFKISFAGFFVFATVTSLRLYIVANLFGHIAKLFLAHRVMCDILNTGTCKEILKRQCHEIFDLQYIVFINWACLGPDKEIKIVCLPMVSISRRDILIAKCENFDNMRRTFLACFNASFCMNTRSYSNF